jgi:lysozyme
MNAADAPFVDLAGVPLPDESAPAWIEAQAKLAPLVGRRVPTVSLAHPFVRWFREGPLRSLPADAAPAARPVKWFLAADEEPDTPDLLLLRGWYATCEEPRWSPCQSLFGGRAGRHRGLDLAAPAGVTVCSPVSGRATLNPLGTQGGYGCHVCIVCAGSPPFGVLLAHLECGTGAFPREVKAGEPVAVLGNSEGGLYNGKPNIYGKYDTHLHVEVVTEEGHEDPMTFFELSPQYADDARCFFPADPLRIGIRFPHPALENEWPTPHWRMVLLKLYGIALVLPGALIRWLAQTLFPGECLDVSRKIAAIRREHRAEVVEQVDAVLLETLVSGEDRRFLLHRGFDPIGISRAALMWLRGRRQGGSTIEQQLVRTVTQRRGIQIRRKLLEILLAAEVASRFSKRATAEAYLCFGYYGAGMNGLAQARRRLLAREPAWATDGARLAAEIVARLKYPEPAELARPREVLIERRVQYLMELRSRMARNGWFAAADWSLREEGGAPDGERIVVDRSIAQIKRHEGLRLHAYRCSAGKLTIGYGRNLEDTGIQPDEADLMLQNDLRVMRADVARTLPWTLHLDEVRRAVLEQMAFNMGIDRVLGFERMLACARRADWPGAADEMLASRWHTQVGARARELAEQMRTGRWPDELAMPSTRDKVST